MTSRLVTFVPLSLAAALAGGCTKPSEEGPMAEADLMPVGASSVEGTADFSTTATDRVRIELDVKGLNPGKHGVHIHQYGDCSAADGSSAGEHFNPDGARHGSPDAGMRHPGDLGNLVADNDGRGNMVIEVEALTLDRGRYGILGRSLVIHANPDDLSTQPSGNSGPPVACGVIRAVSGTTAPVLPSE